MPHVSPVPECIPNARTESTGYNATLAAYDVGGSTMGIQSKYACLNDKTSNAANVYRALCCKYMQFYVGNTFF